MRIKVNDVMLDHVAWQTLPDGSAVRAVRVGGSVWFVRCSQRGAQGRVVTLTRISGSGRPPVIDLFDPALLKRRSQIATSVRPAGPISRLRNGDIWDALATSIVRQVIRAGQAKKLYRSFSETYGEAVPIPSGQGVFYLFPTAHRVLQLTDTDFADAGMAFKSRALRSAAEAFLSNGERWSEMSAAELMIRVQEVHRIGPWSAGAAIADITNDYSLYPFADLAVRTWAKTIAPEQNWPGAEPEFAAAWGKVAGGNLSELTALTLAWGSRHVTSRAGSSVR